MLYVAQINIPYEGMFQTRPQTLRQIAEYLIECHYDFNDIVGIFPAPTSEVCVYELMAAYNEGKPLPDGS